MTRLEVTLPVCPVCQSVGKVNMLSMVGRSISNLCEGPSKNMHKRERMEPKIFVLKRGQS